MRKCDVQWRKTNGALAKDFDTSEISRVSAELCHSQKGFRKNPSQSIRKFHYGIPDASETVDHQTVRLTLLIAAARLIVASLSSEPAECEKNHVQCRTCRKDTNLHGVQLHPSLNDIDRGEGPMSDRTADTTSRGTLQVVHEVILALWRMRKEDWIKVQHRSESTK